ncbi:MAG: hypothetical protein NZV14_17920 [Bryobacteraceae bacterium]|nr:hypothetical protein [Bryobacteraceae bacterium]MDW8380042.1 hypothetical protein [Bryobacterales bacterium]
MTVPMAVGVALLAVLVILALVFELRKRQLEFHSRWLSRSQSLGSELGWMRSELLEVKKRLEDAERCLAAGPSGAPLGSGITRINMNRRAQAIRMLRRGEHPTQVSSALSLPMRQVELLSKVSRLAGENRILAGPAQQHSSWTGRAGQPDRKAS